MNPNLTTDQKIAIVNRAIELMRMYNLSNDGTLFICYRVHDAYFELHAPELFKESLMFYGGVADWQRGCNDMRDHLIVVDRLREQITNFTKYILGGGCLPNWWGRKPLNACDERVHVLTLFRNSLLAKS